MKRRSFIQIASAALAGIPLLSKVFARDGSKLAFPATPHDRDHWQLYVRETRTERFGQLGPYYELPRPAVKVTGFWLRRGCESVPYDCEVNESGYIELPKINGPSGYPEYIQAADSYLSMYRPPDAYRIYAPLSGCEKTGSWYFLKEVKFRDAKRARFTVAVDYRDSDLVCAPMPGQQRLSVTFPNADPDQTHWMIYGGGGTPIGIFPT